MKKLLVPAAALLGVVVSMTYHLVIAGAISWGLWLGFGLWVNPLAVAVISYAGVAAAKLVTETLGSSWRRGSLAAKAHAEQVQATQAFHMAQAHPEMADFLGIHFADALKAQVAEPATDRGTGQYL